MNSPFLRFRMSLRRIIPFKNFTLALALAFTLASCSTKEGNDSDAATLAASSPDSGRGGSPTNGPSEAITFAQITDAHLFDAGKKLHGPGVYEEALDNRAALHWAIIEINRLQASGKQIQFVAFTGDWGLENVQVPGDSDSSSETVNCKFPPQENSGEGPIPAVSLEIAAKEVANEMRGLVVSRVYLVPGNNDICNEDVRDLHRYSEFVFELQRELPGRIFDLSHTAEALVTNNNTKFLGFLRNKVKTSTNAKKGTREWEAGEAANLILSSKLPLPDSDVMQNFHLVGLNSASFKERVNFASTDNSGIAKSAQPGHPDYELQRLKNVGTDSGSYLVFTHIPDLKDPAAIKAKPGVVITAKQVVEDAVKKAAGAERSAWDLDPEQIKDWQTIAQRSQVLGIFAGHFHSSKRAFYSLASAEHPLAVRADVAAKTWVAPPLAVKYQFPKPERLGAPGNPVTETARGFLVATVTATGATTASPYWYVTQDQKTAGDGDIPLAEAMAEAGDQHWDKAAAKYAEAMKSTDPRVRATATQGYLQARGKMRECWWLLPPVRWVWVNRVCALWIIAIVLVLLILARPWGRGLLWGLAWVSQSIFMPPFKGRASIQTPAKLNSDAQADLFAAELSRGAAEVAGVLDWFGVKSFAGSVTLLAIPSEVTDKMVAAFPEVVKGVNLAKILEFLLLLARYFTWRVESKLAFCSDPPTGAGATSGPAGEMRAFATLRWAWFTKGSWAVERRARDLNDVNRTAYALAARILWEAFD